MTRGVGVSFKSSGSYRSPLRTSREAGVVPAVYASLDPSRRAALFSKDTTGAELIWAVPPQG